jgi:hypothetical protein
LASAGEVAVLAIMSPVSVMTAALFPLEKPIALVPSGAPWLVRLVPLSRAAQ